MLEVRNGWEVAVRYPSEPVLDANAVVDISHMSAIELSGPDTDVLLQSQFGRDVPVRSIKRNRDLIMAYRLTADRAIIFAQSAGLSIDAAVDVTGGWSSLALYGPDARAILNKITAVDLRDETLPVYHCCQGPIFGVSTLFGRLESHYALHVCPDTAEFLWEVILDAGREFSLKPAGLEWASKHFDRNAKA